MSDEISYSPAWKNALATLFGPDGFTYGQLIPRDVLLDALRMPRPTEKLTADEHDAWRLRVVAQTDALSAALLEDRNMCLQTVIGQGYKIVEPERQTAFALKHGQKGLRSVLKKMGRRLSFIDRTALSSEQARENADALARLSFLQQQVKRARRMQIGEDPKPQIAA